jgi:hypothetical protein
MPAKANSGTRVAIVGGSFIAMEAAASLIGRVLSVDVIAPEEHPLEKVFGRELSDLILEAHARKGVRLTSARRSLGLKTNRSPCRGASASTRTLWSWASALSRAFSSPRRLGRLWIAEFPHPSRVLPAPLPRRAQPGQSELPAVGRFLNSCMYRLMPVDACIGRLFLPVGQRVHRLNVFSQRRGERVLWAFRNRCERRSLRRPTAA